MAGGEYDRSAQDIRRPGVVGRSGDEPDVRELVRLSTLAPSSHNTQPWTFAVEGRTIGIRPDFSRRCRVVDPDDSHLYKSLGCAAENLVHAAAAQGWHAAPCFDAAGDCIVTVLEPGRGAAATGLYDAITRRQCVRKPYDGRSLPPAELATLEAAASSSDVRAVLLTSAARKEGVVELVMRGNAAELAERAYREELLSWMRFNARDALRTRDGLAARTIGSPALPRWLARRVVPAALTPKRQDRTDARALRSSAGVAIFVSPRDDPGGWVDVGRAYERFALCATMLEVRTAHLNQPIEVPSLRAELASRLGLDGELPHLVVRFGRGPPAPYSLRRPVDDVIVDPRRAGGPA